MSEWVFYFLETLAGYPISEANKRCVAVEIEIGTVTVSYRNGVPWCVYVCTRY